MKNTGDGTGFTGTDAFGVTLDVTIGAIEKNDVRAALMRDGLLYSSILVQDSTLWCNAGLGQILRDDPDGVELLRNRVLVPLRRDTSGTFAASLEDALTKKMANLDPRADRAYAEFLETESGGGRTFPIATVDERYKQTQALTLLVEMLVAFGITESTADTYLRLVAESKGKEGASTNTYLWDVIMPHLPQDERPLVWQCARAPYIVSVPFALGTGIACPVDFSGDRLLAALAQQDRALPSLGVAPADVTIGAFTLRINEPLVNWLLSDETLRRMTAEDLASARSSSSRPAYLELLSTHFAHGDRASWDALAPVLEAYLRQVASEVFTRFLGDGRLGKGPAEDADAVVVTGGAALNIAVPDEGTLHLVGATGNQAIQIIGRPIPVPAVAAPQS